MAAFSGNSSCARRAAIIWSEHSSMQRPTSTVSRHRLLTDGPSPQILSQISALSRTVRLLSNIIDKLAAAWRQVTIKQPEHMFRRG